MTLSVPAHAQFSVILGGWSHHELLKSTDKYPKLNESHNTLGARYKDYFAVTFDNTFNRKTQGVGRFFEYGEFDNGRLQARFGWTLGAVRGYTREQMHIVEQELSPFYAISGSLAVTYKTKQTAQGFERRRFHADIGTSFGVGAFRSITTINFRVDI